SRRALSHPWTPTAGQLAPSSHHAGHPLSLSPIVCISPASIARRLLERLAPHLKRGMGVFLLYGNHDNLPLFQLMGALTAEMAGGPGRWPLVIADRPAVYELPGLPHVVVGLPYLTQRQLLNRTIEDGISPEEQASLLSGQVGQWLQWLYR